MATSATLNTYRNNKAETRNRDKSSHVLQAVLIKDSERKNRNRKYGMQTELRRPENTDD